MAEARKWRRWAARLAAVAAVLAFGAVAAAWIGAFGSAEQWWHFRSGFFVLRCAFYAAAAGALLALLAAFARRRGGEGLGMINILSFVVAAGLLFYLYGLYRTAHSVPPIHDITTNLEDYPRFYRLRVRDDNLAQVPSGGRPELDRMTPRDRWRTLHREAYPDLRTVRVPWSVEETVRRAARIAGERGWEVATVDVRQGVMEAVDTTRFFRFQDNVVVRVTPITGGGEGSMVDMRSISRVGVSDVGTNAERIREFLADLQRP
ncbi:MAG TPA: DUF1499 domain-containing protein [Allosphingosinicella sp.]